MDKKKLILNSSASKQNIGKFQELVELFEHNIKQYTKSSYDESNTRSDFIDKFFALLDWDLNNDQGYAEQYREVVREDKVKIEGQQKAPDYSFRVGGQKKFFVEAKKPSVNIKDDIGPAFQLRRYAYSANLPLSILTDFEEFAVYDTRIKPNANDKASVARVFYCKFDEYIDNFEYLYNTFSKNAILKGSFDQYVEDKKKQKGTSEVDKEFLKLIETWRNDLAKNIALRNKSLDIYALNESVQKIIDRIIFLRIAEDRNIEKYNTLGEIVKKQNSYKLLADYFVKADAKYNSGLFKVEEWLNKIKVDDNVLKSIISTLYYPESPYVFSEIPVEIIGQIYEQFLGKTIHLTKSHQAKVEEKPEVRKAGGVYYTPQYIVDYIVKNTVGEMIKNKKPEKVAELNILDPACGSGSFLLGVYNFLLNWHLDYYTDKKRLEKSLKQSKIYNFKDGFKLTFATKRNILTNNLYGVDIDSQAVEVTKLSLLLKLMEDETQESATQLLKFDKHGLLPDLSSNIKCGNSLIGSDFYEGQISLLDDEVKSRKINVFDWEDKEKGFGEVMDNGGFDVVIGNPPWVFTKYVEWGEETKNYLAEKYLSDFGGMKKSKARQAGKINLFAIFTRKGNELLRKNGLFGYIIPNTILRTTVYDVIRKYLLENTKITKIVDLKTKIFKGVTASTIMMFFSNGYIKNNKISIIDNPEDSDKIINEEKLIKQDMFKENTSYSFNIFTNNEKIEIFNKMKKDSSRLGEIVDVLNGIATSKNKEGIKDEDENEYCKKILFGKDVKPYYHKWADKYIEYIPSKLLRSRDEKIFLAPEKLIMQRIGGILVTSYDDKQYYSFNSINNILLKDKRYLLKFVLAILNSKLMKFYYIENFTNKSTLTVNISKTYLDELPIPEIVKEKQERIVSLVDQMIEAQKKYHSVKIESDKALHKKKIDILDKQIDQEVYNIYGLWEKDIKIIENN